MAGDLRTKRYWPGRNGADVIRGGQGHDLEANGGERCSHLVHSHNTTTDSLLALPLLLSSFDGRSPEAGHSNAAAAVVCAANADNTDDLGRAHPTGTRSDGRRADTDTPHTIRPDQQLATLMKAVKMKKKCV